jgi:hypothetical protein
VNNEQSGYVNAIVNESHQSLPIVMDSADLDYVEVRWYQVSAFVVIDRGVALTH